MNKFIGILRSIDTIIHKVLLIIAQASLFAMIALVIYTVTLRYVFNTGIIWAEELPRTLVALFAFIACAMGVRDHFHIGIGFVYDRMKKDGKGRKAFDIIINLAIFACGAIMLYYGWNLCAKLGRSYMPATGWPRWTQYISMPICGTIIAYDSLLILFKIIKDDDLLYTEKEVEYEVIHTDKHIERKTGGMS
jgi:TRAP-type C4-dicarboxylate transport system permease small subunit